MNARIIDKSAKIQVRIVIILTEKTLKSWLNKKLKRYASILSFKHKGNKHIIMKKH